jgi:iron-sulfur cluster assembly accessory protein
MLIFTPYTARLVRAAATGRVPLRVAVMRAPLRVAAVAALGAGQHRGQSTASRQLKPAAFAQPKEAPKAAAPQAAAPPVPQEDIDDFNVTKLVHGQTDLAIAITSRASRKLTGIAEQDHNPHTALKINVESGGCHGFQYNLALSDLEQEIAAAKAEGREDELLVFQRQQEGQVAYVIMDESSLQILQDSKIDYTKELIGSSFKVVDSPYTSTACGCGASFDFDFEKLAAKQAA